MATPQLYIGLSYSHPKLGDHVQVSIHLRDENGNDISNAPVTITVTGPAGTVEFPTYTSEYGAAFIYYDFLLAGGYTFTVTFDGDAQYGPATASTHKDIAGGSEPPGPTEPSFNILGPLVMGVIALCAIRAFMLLRSKPQTK